MTEIQEEKHVIVLERERLVLEQKKLSKLKNANEELHRAISIKKSSKDVTTSGENYEIGDQQPSEGLNQTFSY